MKGYRKHRDVIGETDSRTDYFFQRSTSATDGKDIRLYQMEGGFSSIMEALIRKRLRVWKFLAGEAGCCLFHIVSGGDCRVCGMA